MILFTNPIITAYRDADVFGKLIFLILCCLSVGVWTILLQKLLVQKKFTQSGKQLQYLLFSQKQGPLSISISDETTPFSDLYNKIKITTLEKLSKNQKKSENKEGQNITISKEDLVFIEERIFVSLSFYKDILNKNIFILSMIISLAPFLGLLGTVWGILVSFNCLSFADMDKTIIMSGLSTALATTVLGLIVAIPALVSYNYLKSSISSLLTDIEQFGYKLVEAIEHKYYKS